MKQLIVPILLIITVFSCKNVENSCGQAYIGGEIINPNNDYLTIYNESSTGDTIYLDENNRFYHHFESLNPGLYTIVHGDEAQFAIVEPNDSLMIRLNTIDFDESFVYSGRGSKKNNYLINLYLDLDEEDRVVSKLSRSEDIEQDELLAKLDSMKLEKYNSLNSFIERYPTSDLFKKVGKLSIDFSNYTRKELYPLRHYGMNSPISLDSLPKNYYDFRKKINYNDNELTEFYPYYNFLFPHFNNLASEKYFKETGKLTLDRTNVDYNLNKLELINDLVHSEEIKNILLKYSTRNFLSNAKSFNDSELVYNSFIEKNTNEENEQYITSLYSTIKRLKEGNILPEVEILNYKNEVTTLNEITSKPSVLYFWSNKYKEHFKNSHYKVKNLQEAYPNIDFISININSNTYKVWKRILKQHQFDYKQEYRFKNPQAARKLLAIQYVNKVFVIDANSTIIASNANIFDYSINKLLDKIK